MSTGPLAHIAQLVDATSHRISSYDQTGGNRDHANIPAGETFVLGDIEGPGIIKHIWMTIGHDDKHSRRNLILRIYWDGQEHPSVESPVGEFFGQGWGLNYNWQSLPLAAAPHDGTALVCYFPMPFGKRARVTITNDSEVDCRALYYYLDYEKHASLPPDLAYFHAQYRQEHTGAEDGTGWENEWECFGEFQKNTTGEHNYVFCEPEGRVHYVGVNYYVSSETPIWYGEGDDMFFVDGEPWPGSAHGTGTEDYFNQSWCPRQVYQHPYFGAARLPGDGNDSERFGWIGRTHVYRFHLEDPIRFSKSLRASIEHGHANALVLDLASVAYWYQTLPSKPFGPFPTRAEREPKPESKAIDLHRELARARGTAP